MSYFHDILFRDCFSIREHECEEENEINSRTKWWMAHSVGDGSQEPNTIILQTLFWTQRKSPVLFVFIRITEIVHNPHDNAFIYFKALWTRSVGLIRL